MPVSNAWTDPSTSGALDLTTGATLIQSVWEGVLSNLLYLGGVTAAAATFTPTLTQSGALTLSVATGRSIKIGKLVVATISITVNSSGSAGNNFVLGGITPVASTLAGSAGFGLYIRGVSPIYSIVGQWVSSSTINFVSGGVASPLGTTPSFAAAAADQLVFTLIYETA